MHWAEMRFRFVHQNFPGQYLHIARRLAADPVHDVTFLSHPNANQISTIRKVEYKPICASTPNIRSVLIPLPSTHSGSHTVYSSDLRDGHNGWVRDIEDYG